MPAGWINAVAGKFTVVTVDGQKVLQKAPDNTLFKRMRMFMGAPDWSNYTVEADVRTPTRRRQQGDVGITAQRYSLVYVRHRPAAEDRTVGARDDPHGDGAVRVEAGYLVSPQAARGKPAERDGPGAGQSLADGRRGAGRWTIEKTDPIGNRQGYPGVFMDVEFGAYLDNLKIAANQ